VTVLVGAACFGLLMAAIKGQGADARDAFGNLSAPWLLLSFVAGACAARIRVAALVGLAAALTALAAFYIGESVILDLGRHSWITDLNLTMRAGRIYFVQAVVSGPLLGGLGGVWAKRRSALVAAAVALLFAFEPLTVWLYERRTGSSGGAGALTHYRWMWIGEVLLGLIAAAFVTARRVRR
jgi:Family of unknown function (DUF6518)